MHYHQISVRMIPVQKFGSFIQKYIIQSDLTNAFHQEGFPGAQELEWVKPIEVNTIPSQFVEYKY